MKKFISTTLSTLLFLSFFNTVSADTYEFTTATNAGWCIGYIDAQTNFGSLGYIFKSPISTNGSTTITYQFGGDGTKSIEGALYGSYGSSDLFNEALGDFQLSAETYGLDWEQTRVTSSFGYDRIGVNSVSPVGGSATTTFSITENLIYGDYYLLVFSPRNSGVSQACIIGGTSTISTSHIEAFYYQTSTTGMGGSPQVVTPYLVIESNSIDANGTVELKFPTEGIQIPDFINWVVETDITPENAVDFQSTPLNIGVNYGTNSSSLNLYNEISFSGWDNSMESPENTGIVPRNQSLQSGTWYAQAYVKNALTGTIYATSSLISFISGELNSSINPTEITIAAGIIGMQTSTLVNDAREVCTRPTGTIFTSPGDNLGYALCATGVALFVPSTQAQNSFIGTVQGFKDVFPFSVFFNLKDRVTENVQGIEDLEQDDLILSFNKPGGGTIELPLLTSSTFTTFGSSSFATVQTLLETWIWLGLAVIVIMTIL